MFKEHSAINDDPVVAWIDKVRNIFVSHPQFTWFIKLFTPMMDTKIDDRQETQQ